MFDPRQIDPGQNKYFGAPVISVPTKLPQGTRRSIAGSWIKSLHIFHGDPTEITASLIEKDGVDAVFVNKDYTPFARKA